VTKLTEDEVRGIVENRVHHALGAIDSELTSDREKALDFYYGRPLGNEIDGRAQVVTKDLMDVIEWRMPSLMRIFATMNAVQFDPVGPEDTNEAKQETGYVRHVIWKKNPGFMTIYNWLKDGLMQKVGYVKYWWEEEEKLVYDEYSALTEDQLVHTLQQLEAEGEVEVVGSEVDDQGLHSIKLRIKKKRGLAKIECVPPEEVVVSASCRGNVKDADFVGHLRTNVKRSDLIEMGFDRKRVEALTDYSINPQYRLGSVARDTVNETRGDLQGGKDWSSEEITLLECFTYIDEDDDGIAELRQLLLSGNDTLEDNEASEIQWESWTPFPVPHRHVGLSEYDRMEDLQRINTALTRGVLDNVYFTMNPRLIYDKGTVDTSMLQINRPGGHVANDGPPTMSIMPIPVQPMAGQILPVIDHFEQQQEKRTGVGRASQGLDADVLSQSTKGAYIAAQSSSNQMTEAIARIFAETGMSSLYSSVHRLLMRHQDYPTRFQLGANWVEVNPTEWQERANLTVSVGLGNSSKDEIRANLGAMANAQAAARGADPALIQSHNIFSLFKRMQSELGLENEDFITDPSSDEYKKASQQASQPAPDPYVTAEQMKQQGNLQGKMIDAHQQDLDRAQERDLTITELEVKSGVDLAKAGIGAEVAARRAQSPGGGGRTTPVQSADPGSVQ
jgi:hypothetical protein